MRAVLRRNGWPVRWNALVRSLSDPVFAGVFSHYEQELIVMAETAAYFRVAYKVNLIFLRHARRPN